MKYSYLNTMKKLILYLGMCILMIGLALAGPNTDLRSGLVAYYQFEGNATDISGNGNDGTLNSVTNVTGIIDNAFGFDGDSNIIINTIQNLTHSFTINIWVYASPMPSSYDAGIVVDHAGAGGGYYLYYLNLNPIADYDNDSLNVYATNPTDIDFNRWVLLTYVYDESIQNVSIWYNGTRTGTVFASSGFISNNVPTYIGSFGASAYFNGTLDEVGIWNRSLNTSEIATLYNNGVGLTYPFDRKPTMQIVNVSPEIAYYPEPLNCSALATDNYNTTLSFEYEWFKNGVLQPQYSVNKTGANNTLTYTDILVNATSSDEWLCNVRVFSTEYSDYLNDSITMLDPTPSLECYYSPVPFIPMISQIEWLCLIDKIAEDSGAVVPTILCDYDPSPYIKTTENIEWICSINNTGG